MPTLRPILSAALLAALSCGRPATPAAASPPAAAAPAPAAHAAPGQARFSEGARAFQEAFQLLRTRYHRDDLSDDELYRAAVQGMLEHADEKLAPWNQLMTPAELAAMNSDLKGELVGIGVEIKFDDTSGASDVLYVLPGSPAERAGIVGGDRILSVNGQRFQGKTLVDMVSALRGREGEVASLASLHGDRVSTLQVPRGRVVYEPVTAFTLPGSVGYVHVRSFAARTADDVRGALQRLLAQKARGFILDLRSNHGGLLEQAVATADLLLPRGTIVARLARRGGSEETFTAHGGAVLGNQPLLVVTNGETASGAELLAAALQGGRGAQIVGQKTLGKWSVQTIETLHNGYALKFTSSGFRTAAGKSFEGQGLTPDVEVALDPKQAERLLRVRDPERRLAEDVQLRTAANLLKLLGR